jgi:serine/threonine protein kinase
MHEGSDDPPSTRPSGAAGSAGTAASRGPPSRAEPPRDAPVAPSLARTSEGPANPTKDPDRAPGPAAVHEGAPRPTDDEGLDATEIAPSASLSPVNSSPSRPSTRSSSVAERLERRREKDPRVGTTLSGRYRLEKAIAKGGMGRVYLATQLQLGRSVAVKILNPEFRDTDPQFVRRFSIEASICARLAHPNVVTVHDYGESETGELFMAMELLRGKTLSAAVQKEAPFAPARTIHIALQVARALREAHVLGIIHRDLKPGNIMLVEAGDDADFVKVLDFGLVKLIAPESGEAPAPAPDDVDLTRQGTLLGSPRYMSPEQIRGEVLDPRTDIYSFGIILFQMAAGRPPFTGSGSVDLIYKHIHEKPPRVSDVAHGDCPPELEDLIAQCSGEGPSPTLRFDGRRDHRAQAGAELHHGHHRASAHRHRAAAAERPAGPRADHRRGRRRRYAQRHARQRGPRGGLRGGTWQPRARPVTLGGRAAPVALASGHRPGGRVHRCAGDRLAGDPRRPAAR